MQTLKSLRMSICAFSFVLFFTASLNSQSITVSGAGSGVNGTYNLAGTYEGRNYYERFDGYAILWRPECGNLWTIITGPGYVFYSHTGNTTLPPTAGWTTAVGGCASAGGVDPAPTLTGDVDPLPVELTGMSASVSGNIVTLKWGTATEVNNAGFEVERRAISGRRSDVDGRWWKVGFILGAGTSTAPLEYSWTDKILLPDPNEPVFRYVYRLKQIDINGSYSFSHEAEIEVGAVASEFHLGEAYPNPFNPSTSIEFSLAEAGVASMKVYNALGQEVATLYDTRAEAGRLYRVSWDASNLPSGIYVARLESGKATGMTRLILVK